MAKAKPLTESQMLRLKADRLDAEAAVTKPERETCGECGRKIPWTPEQRAGWKKQMAKARALRLKEREARDLE